MVVRAPFDGVAISKDAQPGEMISPVSAGGGFTRTGICTIVDMSSLEIEVDVNESYINRVQPASGSRRCSTRIPTGRSRRTSSPRSRPPIGRRRPSRCGSGSSKLDPRILPDMGVKVTFLRDEDPSAQARTRAADDRAQGGAAIGRRTDGRVRRARRPRRAPRHQRRGLRTTDKWRSSRACQPASASSPTAPATLKDGDKVKVQ